MHTPPPKSILSSLFKTSGFHHYRTDELSVIKETPPNGQEQSYNRTVNLTRDRPEQPAVWVHYDYLPSFRAFGKTVRTFLWCVDAYKQSEKNPEKSLSNQLYRAIKKSPQRDIPWDFNDDGVNRGSVITEISSMTNESGESSPTFDFEKFDPRTIKDYVSNSDGNLVINIKIGLDGEYFNEDIDNTPLQELRHCERKEWFAMELTTGYRRYAKNLSDLFGKQGASGRGQTPKFLDAPELHPSIEGAWRLICSFDSIKKSLDLLEMWEYFENDRSLCRFLKFMDEQRKDYRDFLDYWRTEKRVKPHVAEKKAIEFFKFQRIINQ